MNPERWQRLTQIVNDCLEAAADQRAAKLQELCAGDAPLQREAMELIATAERTQGFLDEPASLDAITRHPAAGELSRRIDQALSPVGQRLGAYRLTEEIARGGMGVVYRALRADDSYEKEVAVKLLRDDVDAAQVAERFRAERQILAGLEHPNIARLIDGGTTDQGLPYLVMEYVDGEPITRYAQRHDLDVPARLQLFRTVCNAVHFAHQRLVVHRDLKPNNIFVTHTGDVKLLDFGIAKVLDLSPAADALATTVHALTPAYASPEQVKGESVTTTSDIYALGVVLYELLTGQSPYKSARTQPLALAKEICETDPERPSTVVGRTETGGAETFDTTPVALNLKRLQRGLRGDLDNIVLMALRKDPSRRYASAGQLSDDVERYLHNLPVAARADTFTYRASKFVARNRWPVAFASLAVIGLIGGIIATTYQASIARQAQARAEQNFADVRKLANDSLFELHESIKDLPGSTPARQQLIEKAIAYLERLSAQSASDPALAEEIGWGWLRLAELQGGQSAVNTGELSAAEVNYQKALKTLVPAHQARPTHPGVGLRLAMAHRGYGAYLATLNRQDEAVSHFADAVRIGESFADDRADTLLNRIEITSSLLYRANFTGSGDTTGLAAKVADCQRALQILETLLAREGLSADVRKRAESNLAYVFQSLGYLALAGAGERAQTEALQWAEKGVALQERMLARDPDNTLHLYNTGNAYGAVEAIHRGARRYAEAIASGEKAYSLFDRVSIKSPADNGAAISKLLRKAYVAVAQLNAGKSNEAAQSAAVAQALWLKLGEENRKISVAGQARFVIVVVEGRIAARAASTADATADRERLCGVAATAFKAAKAYQAAQGENNSFGESIYGPDKEALKDLRACKATIGDWVE